MYTYGTWLHMFWAQWLGVITAKYSIWFWWVKPLNVKREKTKKAITTKINGRMIITYNFPFRYNYDCPTLIVPLLLLSYTLDTWWHRPHNLTTSDIHSVLGYNIQTCLLWLLFLYFMLWHYNWQELYASSVLIESLEIVLNLRCSSINSLFI